MSNLKSEIIRIAFKHPETRKHLLPLITGAADRTAFGHPETSTSAPYESRFRSLVPPNVSVDFAYDTSYGSSNVIQYVTLICGNVEVILNYHRMRTMDPERGYRIDLKSFVNGNPSVTESISSASMRDPSDIVKDALRVISQEVGLTRQASVADMILRQLGGINKIVAMTGAKDFVQSSNSVRFKIGRNIIVIRLEPSDTHTVEFWQGTRLRKSYDDVYADSLKRLIEKETGMYLSL